jgi:phosphosulfolactate phosphohydrolase-like enzyme
MSISASRGGRNLVELGYLEDIRCAARRDVIDIVPEFFPAERAIRPATTAGSRGT